LTSSKIVVVADAGPLIALARIDSLALLAVLGGAVHVPLAVEQECLCRPWRPGAQQIAAALSDGALLRFPGSGGTGDAAVIPTLGAGESAAIAAAQALGALLLIDERRGRAAAAARGIDVVGTLGLLVIARRSGHLGPLAPALSRLEAAGYHLAPRLVASALEAVGEG
jgi:predicted nucleic acid-binding protein